MKERTQYLLFGFAGGAIVSAALPFVAPVVAEILRPLTKSLIKQSIFAADRMRTQAARASEALEDILAEVRVEVAEELEHGTITRTR